MMCTKEKKGLTYTLVGEYDVPDLVSDEVQATYGKYGMLRREYLKKHRKARYNILIMQGKLNKHLNEVDQEAKDKVERLVKQMTEQAGVNEVMKEKEQMLWVRKVNEIIAAAEEIVLRELVYN